MPKKDNIKLEPVHNKPVLKFRYYCEACTGRALYSSEKMPFASAICKNCGATVKYKPENWLEMNDEEIRKVNG